MWPDCPRRNAAKAYRDLIQNHTGILLRETVPHIGAIVGTAVHKAAEYTMATKLESGELGKDDEATERAIDSLKKGASYGAIWDNTTPRPNDAEKQTIRMARAFRQTVAPKITPIAVETRLEADVGDGFFISGQSDVVTITPEGIRDTKTGAVQRVNMAQLGGYGITTALHHPLHGGASLTEDYIERATLRRQQPPPVEINYDPILAGLVTWAHIRMIKNQITEFMRTGEPLSFPSNPNSMLCSEKFCPAWGTEFCREHKGAK